MSRNLYYDMIWLNYW